MAKLIRFQRKDGDLITAAELFEAYSRLQLARLATREAERGLRELCGRALSGATIEECDFTLDPQLGILLHLPRAKEEGE